MVRSSLQERLDSSPARPYCVIAASSSPTNHLIMNQIKVEKFPLVDKMRATGGNFVSKLADAMVAADPVNFSRLCDAFPEIVSKYGDEGQPAYTWTDCRRIHMIADGLPEAKDRDSTGRVWWGTPDRSDEQTRECYAAAWYLQERPWHGCTSWMPASDLRAPVLADEEDTYWEEG
jgi:hypothetical protein